MIALIAGSLSALGTFMAASANRSFEEGTPFVPETGLFMLHEGESVIPAEDNAILTGILAGRLLHTPRDREDERFPPPLRTTITG